jgi:putative PEP-CTERM system histidine kinase
MLFLVASHALCALLYLGVAGLLWHHSEHRLPSVALILACAVTGLWGVARATASVWPLMEAPAVALQSVYAPIWVGFLLVAHRTGLPASQRGRAHWLGLGLVGVLSVVLLISAVTQSMGDGPLRLPVSWGRLALMLSGLVVTEALLRQSRADGRWRISYLCVGVGAVLAYDLFITSEALVMGRIDSTLVASQSMVSVIALPLIAVGAARNPLWSAELNVARSAIFRVGTLYAMSVYLLLLGLAGAAVRSYGGEWGGYAQAALLFSALLALVVAWSSEQFRARLQRGVARSIFTHRHDYREQWFRFTEALSSPTGGGNLQERTLRAIAQVVDSPGGALWLRTGDVFVHVAGRKPREADDEMPSDAPFARWLSRIEDRTVEIRSERFREQQRDIEPLPDWLSAWSDAWLVVPLIHFDDVLGFVVLRQAVARSEIDVEDEELLRAVAHHASSALSSEQTTLRLEEVRHFEAISRGTAYIAHDLRNLTNELSLTLANVRRHLQNPEFQRDLITSMEESVHGMQRLLDKLKEMPDDHANDRVVDVVGTIRGALRIYKGARPLIQLDIATEEAIHVACDVDRLLALSGHLIRNAIEAVGPDGRVDVRISREDGRALIEVEDNGPGMAPELVRMRLHHPFHSTKRKGFGLGLYECRDLARTLGGGLRIESEVGSGTLVRVWLPLVDDAGAAPNGGDTHAAESGAEGDFTAREEPIR